jgi:hypothetical protein
VTVATKLVYEQNFAGEPAVVMAMFRDPAYVQEKGERTGSHGVTVEVVDTDDGGVAITSMRTMPSNVPSFAAPFVGETLTVTEVQTWGPPADDGSATAAVTVAFSAPISYHGSIVLTAGASGSIARTEGEFKAGVPFVGGKIEKVASEQTERYLVKEETVGAEWLAGG